MHDWLRKKKFKYNVGKPNVMKSTFFIYFLFHSYNRSSLIVQRHFFAPYLEFGGHFVHFVQNKYGGDGHRWLNIQQGLVDI